MSDAAGAALALILCCAPWHGANTAASHLCDGTSVHQGLDKGWQCDLRPSQLPLLWQDHRAAARMFRDERDQRTADIYKAMRCGDYQLSDKLKKEVSHLLCWHAAA